MKIFEWMKAGVSNLRKRNLLDRQSREKADQVEQGEYSDAATFADSKFHEDYDFASLTLKRRLNEHFPDSYHAKSLPGYDPKHDYSAKRGEAIETSSAAIAAALRGGAGVTQAVTAGSRSIGL